MSITRFNEKVVSAAEAVKLVKSKDVIVIGHSSASPNMFLEALMARAGELRHVQLRHTRIEGSVPYLKNNYGEAFFHNSFMISAEAREPMVQGRADYLANCYVNIPKYISSGDFPVDVAVLHLSPPNKYGYCSYGICASYLPATIGKARVVIAEINKQMPTTHGACVHLSDVHCIIEADYPLASSPLIETGPLETRIGRHVATLVEDGSTLQIGIGGIPNAVLAGLEHHKDLGIHTEMYADGVVNLVEKGVITSRRRGYHPGKLTSTFVMGTRTTFDFVHDNSMVEIRPVSETNNPANIMRNHKFIAINGAVEVDVTGQICAESVGTRHISGTGGQLDFALGAHYSEGGKFVVAMPSTVASGKHSRIVACLREGACVTTPRSLADYVVTEYGVAALRGKNLAQRAKALLDIAHPDFREDLERKMYERHDVSRVIL